MSLIGMDLTNSVEKRRNFDEKIKLLNRLKVANANDCCQKGLYMLHVKGDKWKCDNCETTWKITTKIAKRFN